MILVDTSIWIQHFRKGDAGLQILLKDGEVLCHPLVIGELACGNLKNRQEILECLRSLPQAEHLNDNEVLQFLEAHRIFGQGIGWMDAHLLASVFATGCLLWTYDKSLQRIAEKMRLVYHR